MYEIGGVRNINCSNRGGYRLIETDVRDVRRGLQLANDQAKKGVPFSLLVGLSLPNDASEIQDPRTQSKSLLVYD